MIDGTDQAEGVSGTDEASGAGEAGGGSTEASSDSTGAPALVEWNGEVEHLTAQDWYKGLDPAIQPVILKGIEAKYQNYDKKYRSTWDEQAKARRTLEERERAVAESEKRAMRLWTGEEDPAAYGQAEVAQLKKAHAEMVERMVADHRAELEKHKGPTPELVEKVAALQQVEARLREIEAERDAMKGRLGEIEQAEQAAAIDAFGAWLDKEAPHIVADGAPPEAFESLTTLINAGVPAPKALRMVLVGYPAPKPEPAKPAAKPAAPGPGVRAMSGGSDGGTSRRDTRDLNEVMDTLRRQAQQPWNGG